MVRDILKEYPKKSKVDTTKTAVSTVPAQIVLTDNHFSYRLMRDWARGPSSGGQ